MSRPDICPNCGSEDPKRHTGSYCQDCGEILFEEKPLGRLTTTYQRIPGTDDNGTRRAFLEERRHIHEGMSKSAKTRRRHEREKGIVEGIEQALHALDTEVAG